MSRWTVLAAGAATLFGVCVPTSPLPTSPLARAGDWHGWYPRRSQRECLHPGDCQFGFYGTSWRAWPEDCDRGWGGYSILPYFPGPQAASFVPGSPWNSAPSPYPWPSAPVWSDPLSSPHFPLGSVPPASQYPTPGTPVPAAPYQVGPPMNVVPQFPPYGSPSLPLSTPFAPHGPAAPPIPNPRPAPGVPQDQIPMNPPPNPAPAAPANPGTPLAPMPTTTMRPSIWNELNSQIVRTGSWSPPITSAPSRSSVPRSLRSENPVLLLGVER